MANAIILKGDTIAAIAELIGSSGKELYKLNPEIKRVGKMYIGQPLQVPNTKLGIKFAAGRRSAWADILRARINKESGAGNWGAWNTKIETSPITDIDKTTSNSNVLNVALLVGLAFVALSL